MAAKAIKRRTQHAGDDRKYDAETSASDDLSEPLLGKHDYDEDYSEGKCDRSEPDFGDDGKRKYHGWRYFLSHSIAQCAQWLGNISRGFGSIVRKLFHHSTVKQEMKGDNRVPIILNSLQEERLINLRRRLEIPFDGSFVDHQDALRELWRLAYPNRELPSLKSELWKEMGWQGSDPSTDFRAGGFMSLENLIYLAKNYPNSFRRLLYKQDGKRAEWEYPFAVAGINISHMLKQMLDLQSGKKNTGAVRTAKVQIFLMNISEFLEEDEMAFDMLYCVAFQILDSQWLQKQATYMEFNEVLKSTRAQLEQELTLEGVSSIKEMPSYKLLSK